MMQSTTPEHEPSLDDELLLNSDLFRAFPPIAHAALAQALTPVVGVAGEVLFEQGGAGDSMYLIYRGQLAVLLSVDTTDQLVGLYGPGASVGEIALITGAARTARVVFHSESTLLRLARSDFDQLAAQYPQALAQFTQILTPRIRRSQVGAALVGLFGELSQAALEDVLQALEWRTLRSGEVLFQQGDPGDSLAIVITGRLHVLVAGEDQQQRLVSELAAGQAVGELALLTGEPRSATVQAIRDSDVVLLARSAFDRLLAHYPQAMLQLTRVVIERLRRTSSQPMLAATRPGLNIALVALDTARDLTQIAAALFASFQKNDTALWLSSGRLDSMLDRAGLANRPDEHPAVATLNSWLGEAEANHRYLVYQADATLSAWTLRCLRHADLVVLVGAAGAPAIQAPVEHLLDRLDIHARRVLVLTHQQREVATGESARWLALRPELEHYHVRVDDAADMARLARLLSGRAIGLVLGGGGARGFAHIGVLRALEEAGIVPDALDLLARNLLQDWRRPDYTLPLVSLLRGQKLSNQLQQLFGEIQIEDLWRPFFCPSVNLSRLEVQIHRRGSLWRAVRASTSLPLIFPPLLEHGQVLVDGGVIDNLPVPTMRRACPEGMVIGVDVAQEAALNKPYRYEASVSGWQMLFQRLRPASARLVAPSLVDTLLRVLEYSAVTTRHANAAIADLLIRPPVTQYGTLEFSAYEAIVEAGYLSAQVALQQRE
jgi:predicted acylesterase/phospholipase RssA/CRP-like cAMP-binding protein